jgi:hypothetical protein
MTVIGERAMKKQMYAYILLAWASAIQSAPLNDFNFKSPAFNGIGYSSHVLTIENQERTRQKEREDKFQAILDKAASEAKNTNLSKFLSNLESRIYAQISQNVATAMFANNGCSVSNSSSCQGSVNFQGNQISWQRVADAFNCTGSANGTCIQLTVKDPTGGETNIYVPLESFQMPGN